MAKSIQLVKQSTVALPDISSYKLVVRTANAEGISDKIFVKQRVRNFAKNTIDETFVAVCTPAQLEDFEEDLPGEGSSYFRTNTIELIGRTPEWLSTVFDSLIYEVKKLVVDLTDLEVLGAAATYNITALDAVLELSEAPTIGSIVRSYEDESVTVNFTNAVTPQGSTPLNYQYSLDGGVTWKDRMPGSLNSPITIRGLSNNTTYNLKLRAYFGGSLYGPESSDFVINTVNPAAAVIDSITRGSTQFSVAFISTNKNIVNYEYSLNAGATWTARAPASAVSPLVITGLTSNTTYNIKIRGIDAQGYGVASDTEIATTLAS